MVAWLYITNAGELVCVSTPQVFNVGIGTTSPGNKYYQ